MSPAWRHIAWSIDAHLTSEFISLQGQHVQGEIEYLLFSIIVIGRYV